MMSEQREKEIEEYAKSSPALTAKGAEMIYDLLSEVRTLRTDATKLRRLLGIRHNNSHRIYVEDGEVMNTQRKLQDVVNECRSGATSTSFLWRAMLNLAEAAMEIESRLPSPPPPLTEEQKCTCAGDVVTASDSRNKDCPLHGTKIVPTIEPPEAIAERLIKQTNSSRRFEFPGPSKTIVLYAGELATQSDLQIILDGLRENLSAAISLHRGQIESAAREKAIAECSKWLIDRQQMRNELLPHPPQEARTQ